MAAQPPGKITDFPVKLTRKANFGKILPILTLEPIPPPQALSRARNKA